MSRKTKAQLEAELEKARQELAGARAKAAALQLEVVDLKQSLALERSRAGKSGR